jgi:hypothetical protein
MSSTQTATDRNDEEERKISTRMKMKTKKRQQKEGKIFLSIFNFMCANPYCATLLSVQCGEFGIDRESIK